MTRDEIVAWRNRLQEEVATRTALGDYDANAAPIRTALEASLAVVQHLLERSKPSS